MCLTSIYILESPDFIPFSLIDRFWMLMPLVLVPLGSCWNNGEMAIRYAQSNDLSQLRDLAQSSPHAGHWPDHYYSDSLFGSVDRLTLIHSTDNSINGFLVAQEVMQEWELENIVVSISCQRKHIATALMEELVDLAKKKNGVCIHLEVRSQNAPAISLYGKMGFQVVGTRKNYYSDPQDDAILYRLSL
jgi:ribosomal-protein-alanine N-acetyltransferase